MGFHAASEQSRYVCFRMNLTVVGLGGVSSDSGGGGGGGGWGGRDHKQSGFKQTVVIKTPKSASHWCNKSVRLLFLAD